MTNETDMTWARTAWRAALAEAIRELEAEIEREQQLVAAAKQRLGIE